MLSPSGLLAVNAFCSAGRGHLYFSGLTHGRMTETVGVFVMSKSVFASTVRPTVIRDKC